MEHSTRYPPTRPNQTPNQQVQERQSTSTSSSRANPQSQPQPQPSAQQALEECKVVLEGEEDQLLPASFFESLPWSRSITGEGKESLLYMPFVEEQLRHLRELEGEDGVRPLPTPPEVAYTRSERKAAHMGEC